MNVHQVTREFEKQLEKYTGAPYAICVDNCSNALFLSLMYENVQGKEITIPSRTYMSVPCEIIHAGAKVFFSKVDGETITGAYRLEPTRVIDSALRFTNDMYEPNTLMCLSFTGPYKHLKLGKGGAILTDDPKADAWLRRARFSGRREVSYHTDHFDMLGWNFWMMPDVAARGLHMMTQFYNLDGTAKSNKDLTIPYPNLSNFEVYRG
jgi:dTDP-4-amino-4,6-dideoxygalactose transaminase